MPNTRKFRTLIIAVATWLAGSAIAMAGAGTPDAAKDTAKRIITLGQVTVAGNHLERPEPEEEDREEDQADTAEHGEPEGGAPALLRLGYHGFDSHRLYR